MPMQTPCSYMANVDALCRRLFDQWFERRAVISLCHLMNAWPSTVASGEAICRIYNRLGCVIEDPGADVPGPAPAKTGRVFELQHKPVQVFSRTPEGAFLYRR